MNANALDLLGGITPEQFLQEFWQKKPLLIRNALPGIDGLLEPDEVAGLALEEDIESSIIIERSPVDWELRHGPFNDKTFSNLPGTHWSLQVESVDHYCPPAADLLDLFSFIPDWRLDAIAAHYAPAGGSIGPHCGHGDLFLIQTHGQHRWQLGAPCDSQNALIPDLPIPVLQNFQMEQEWVLNPGDVLYLPAGFTRFGMALNECMTLAVSCRAFREQDILLEYAHSLWEQTGQSRYFSDPGIAPQSAPGWISPEAIERMAQSMRQAIANPEKIGQWMASWLSQTKYDRDPQPPESDYDVEEVIDLLLGNQPIRREESTRMLFTGEVHRPERFFINGTEFDIPPLTHVLILYLCKHRLYDPAQLGMFCRTPECADLITHLLNQGILYFEDGGD